MRALIIEDTEDIAECMQQSLRDMGITSDWFTEGRRANAALDLSEYDLLILDLNLPDADGLDVLKALRAGGDTTPVLIVSARISIEDRVSGLDLGADDYLIKPFDLHEFEARVRALLRRDKESRNPVIRFGDLEFDQTTREFRASGELVDLSPRERAVLETLIRQNGTVISKERIAQHVFSFDDEAGVSSIELYVHRLRKKLGHSHVQIVTKRGLGYLLDAEASTGAHVPC
ncbi:MAG: response regulator transcription factor [Pseudomonadota bacterium]